ncbi:MAG: hypothetical protein J7L28_02655 [Thermotogae bacterium]|nr:hypothetical protein [Thermotogota bacterium]RKX53367.1 MAG: hypothetical protein DRP30_04640 [Thermotoga sp.]
MRELVMYLSIIPLFLTVLLMLKKDMWDKLIGLSSITVKIFVIISLFSWKFSQNYLLNLGICFLMLSGAGVSLMILFTIGSDTE